jgi:hypothetical protein
MNAAHAVFRSVRRKGVGIPTNLKRPARSSLYFGAIALGLLSAAGLFAIAPWTGDSSASVPGADAPARQPRAWPRCPECGVIESVRPVSEAEHSKDRADALERARSRIALAASGSAIAAPESRQDGYEVTVRFRNGSTMTFAAATRHIWRVGSPVNVLVGRETLTP